ncbi:MAG: hypothetical protein ACLSG9_03680 [Eubacterium sp.]
MAVFRDTWDGYNGKAWRVQLRYIRLAGEKEATIPREVFEVKRKLQEYEREFTAKKSRDINMGFATFVNLYLEEIKPQIRITTYENKDSHCEDTYFAVFRKRILSEIDATDILRWQNEMLQKRDENGRGYSNTYLRTVNTQLSAIFNHAVRYYGLAENPCKRCKR